MDTGRDIARRMARRMMVAAAAGCLLGALTVGWSLYDLVSKGPLHDPWPDAGSGQVVEGPPSVEPPVAP